MLATVQELGTVPVIAAIGLFASLELAVENPDAMSRAAAAQS
jgi:hypothetical protein